MSDYSFDPYFGHTISIWRKAPKIDSRGRKNGQFDTIREVTRVRLSAAGIWLVNGIPFSIYRETR